MITLKDALAALCSRPTAESFTTIIQFYQQRLDYLEAEVERSGDLGHILSCYIEIEQNKEIIANLAIKRDEFTAEVLPTNHLHKRPIDIDEQEVANLSQSPTWMIKNDSMTPNVT